MKKYPFIVVDACFEIQENPSESPYLEELFSEKSGGKHFGISTRIIFTEHIVAVGPSSYDGIVTIYTGSGDSAFLVKSTLNEIMSMIYPGEELPDFEEDKDDSVEGSDDIFL